MLLCAIYIVFKYETCVFGNIFIKERKIDFQIKQKYAFYIFISSVELRKAVRTSTWQKDLSKHEHDYDIENEVYDEEEDVYTKKCKGCDHEVQYEKM